MMTHPPKKAPHRVETVPSHRVSPSQPFSACLYTNHSLQIELAILSGSSGNSSNSLDKRQPHGKGREDTKGLSLVPFGVESASPPTASQEHHHQHQHHQAAAFRQINAETRPINASRRTKGGGERNLSGGVPPTGIDRPPCPVRYGISCRRSSTGWRRVGRAHG